MRNLTAALRPSPPRKNSASRQRGLTLFEVLLALAIFMGSLAAITQLLANGSRAALKTKLETDAVLRCETKMSEVVAGVLPFQSVSETGYDEDAAWKYKIEVNPGPSDQLFLVTVTVMHPGSNPWSDISYTLNRMVRDPQIFLDAAAAAAAAAEDE